MCDIIQEQTIMKTSELIKILRRNGILFERHGTNHDAYRSTKSGIFIIVPRHAEEIPKGTAEKILKDACIK